MKLKLTRQECEIVIDYFLPYLHRKEEACRYNRYVDHDKLFMQMFFSSMNALGIKIRRRLLCEGKQFTFSVPMHEAAAMLKSMQIIPIPADQYYLRLLADNIIQQLDKQL
jgi:hypothetical protein